MLQTFRKDYSLGKEKSLAWGFDRSGGYFIQIFFDENEDEMLDFDQGEKLSGFSIAQGHLTYDKMTELLGEHSERALSDFQKHIQIPFEFGFIGYKYNKNKKYEKHFLQTHKDFFQFFDETPYGYTVTDIFDALVLERKQSAS